MKSTTSRSLAPRASCARIWLRRSTARRALAPASDWFWHTRQRSSAARSMTRLSSAASSAPATETASNNAKALLAIKFIQQGDELVAHQLSARWCARASDRNGKQQCKGATRDQVHSAGG